MVCICPDCELNELKAMGDSRLLLVPLARTPQKSPQISSSTTGRERNGVHLRCSPEEQARRVEMEIQKGRMALSVNKQADEQQAQEERVPPEYSGDAAEGRE
ncbi:hypothetical protein FB451DRAFT_1196354 [Mycena latifolia]|nr:hypothetical protein FB451DRAFT_1196354 [Mycena latifolia]